MTATLIDGKAIGAAIRAEIAAATAALTAAGHCRPGLGVVLVGDNPASHAYVKSKTKACAEAGFHSVQIDLPVSASEEEVLYHVESLNADPAIHGILVQLPLPAQVRERRILEAILPAKDVDGFHAENAGLLMQGTPRFVPCTPLGVIEVLARTGVPMRGAHAVVVGRSNIVGRPLSVLLSLNSPRGNATVTLAHSATRDLAAVCRTADILVVAAGRANMVTGDMVKPGAAVIDVGINRIDDPAAPKGSRLVGDVDFDSARAVAGWITPVPGGVGPMTIAMLLRNTLDSARRHAGLTVDS